MWIDLSLQLTEPPVSVFFGHLGAERSCEQDLVCVLVFYGKNKNIVRDQH